MKLSSCITVMNMMVLLHYIYPKNAQAFSPNASLIQKKRSANKLSLVLMRGSNSIFNTDSTTNRENNESTLSRRNMISKISSLTVSVIATNLNNFVLPAQAANKEPITKEVITSAFAAVREQLESPTGGIATLGKYVESSDYINILEFTKFYDLEFRKAKMVKARKFITNKDAKEKGLYFSNAVTFDLIGMNRGSRKGQENIDEVKKYYGELRSDVLNFLDLEKGIDLSQF